MNFGGSSSNSGSFLSVITVRILESWVTWVREGWLFLVCELSEDFWETKEAGMMEVSLVVIGDR